MKVIRTDKELCSANMTEDFVRRAVSLGGKHNTPKRESGYKWEHFCIEDRYIGVSKDAGHNNTVSPWSEDDSDRFTKYQDGVEITLKNFDTWVRIWQNGLIQGYYVESHNAQYAANPIEWVNLLLEYEFLKVEP